LTKQLSVTTTFNGVDTHLLANYALKRHVISLVLVRLRDPGLSYSIVF